MRGAYTPQVQEAVTRLGSRLPFREAREELALLWGIEISSSSVRQITLRNGQVADELIEEEVARLEKEAPPPTAQPAQLVMSADGAMVQLTSGEWREVKTVAFGEFASHWDAQNKQVNTKTEQISYFSRVETAEAFAQSALYEWQRRGGENAKRVVAVNDGALWIQSFVDYHCPQAIRVIDLAHALGHLATIGKVVYGAETAAFQQWYARISRQLGTKPPQRTLSELHFLQRQQQDHPEIAVIEQAIRYLDKRKAMIDYPHFRQQQLPIGSGIVESGHKVVMQRRMKQAGMRWAEQNLNPMLALRMAICNQTWSASWQAIQIQTRDKQHRRRLSQTRPPQKPIVPEVVTEADCQRLTRLARRIRRHKPGHPWQNHDWIFPHRQHALHKM